MRISLLLLFLLHNVLCIQAQTITKNNSAERTSQTDLNRVWLLISNETYGLSSETLIGFTPNATAAFDPGYDSNRVATALSIFSHLPDGTLELGIQGREAFNENLQVSLGFSTLVDELATYTITINDIDGVLIENATLYFVDRLENKVANLTEETSYTFTAPIGTYSNRFILQFVNTCNATTSFGSGGWSNAIPNITTATTITEDYNTASEGASINACELTITNNATVTIAAGDYVNVYGNITVDPGATLIVEHQGSAVQTDPTATVTNNGTIEVLLETPELKPKDFILLGSPMTTESTTGVFVGADRVFNHTTANFVPHPDVTAQFPMAENFIDDNFNDYAVYNGTLHPAEGYLVRPRPNNATGNEAYSITYTQGTLNTGAISYAVTYNDPGDGSMTPAEIKNTSYNLLANPYASAISTDDFLAVNPMIDEVFYWNHITSPSEMFPGTFNQNFSMEDVSMYNALGGVAAANDPISTPNELMATGQGFAIKANQGGTAVFTNAMRVTGNNDVLRTATSNAATTNKLWLTVSNEAYHKHSETLIGFTEVTTTGYDQGYDSNRIATPISLYSHLENSDRELAIQGLPPFQADTQISLGFSSLIDTTTAYTISLKNIEGATLENQTIFLIDTFNNTITNLNETTYRFTAGSGTYSHRFTLQFQDRNELSTTSFIENNITIYPNPTQNTLFVNTAGEMIQSIQITDVRGSEVYKQTVSDHSYNVDVTALPAAIYFVRVVTNEGSTVKQIIKN